MASWFFLVDPLHKSSFELGDNYNIENEEDELLKIFSNIDQTILKKITDNIGGPEYGSVYHNDAGLIH